MAAVHRPLDWSVMRGAVCVVAELAAIAAWAIIIGRTYLNFDPMVVPTGGEYMGSIPAHHFWTRVRECGFCALWSGNVGGGSPALGDFAGHVLNPLVAITTLGWGVINGSKLAMVVSFFIIGFAQWWLARELGAGIVARLFTACLAIVAGHLGARLAHGAQWPVSIAMITLVWPALLMFYRRLSWSTAALAGLIIAIVLLDGPTYVSVGLMWTLPALLVLAPRDRTTLQRFALLLGYSAAIAVLVSSPLTIPFIHFVPEIIKDVDLRLANAQPFAYLPLNLVTGDPAFYGTTALGKSASPLYHANFIGWIPVLLAVVGLFTAPRWLRRQTVFLAAVAFIALWIASGEPQAHLIAWIPIPQIQRLVHPGQFPAIFAALAIAPILGLTAVGLDRIVSLNWPRFRISAGVGPSTVGLAVNPSLLLIIPLAFALNDARIFNTGAIGTARLPDDVPKVVAALKTPDLQWVATPYGSSAYLEAATGLGLKRYLEVEYRSWRWRDHAVPEPALAATGPEPQEGWTLLSTIGNVFIYAAPPGREYAVVTHPSGGRTVCQALGGAGDFDVHCNTREPGTLTIKENSWTGWNAYIDGRPTNLASEQWLSLELPAGESVVALRYRPWDFFLGLTLAIVGLLLAACGILRYDPRRLIPTARSAIQRYVPRGERRTAVGHAA